jgi:leucyl/phenylalanyl-tRNA--protein transferase
MTALSLYWIDPGDPPDRFPPPERALSDPDGLLAAGGDLSQARLLAAYRRGIFPWYEAGQPILWWSPDPRMVLFPAELHITRSFRKTLRHGSFTPTRDQAFEDVLAGCARPRAGQHGTWLTNDMQRAYAALNRSGHAHSVEAWHDGKLAGGLYGIAIGRIFFGESMFSVESDASKVALAHLCQQGYELIDCQVASPHLRRLGARQIPRKQFLGHLDAAAYNEISIDSDTE